MTIVVFGEDLFTSAVTASLIEKGHAVKLLITPYYDNNNFKVLEELASKNGIDLIRAEDVNSPAIKEILEKVKPDIIVSAHLRKILHKSIFSLAGKATINIHPSLLPKYRGLSPQHQALLHGDNESGVTVHYIDEDVDTGEIILQEKFDVADEDYIINVQIKMLAIYKRIVADAVSLIESGSVAPIQQQPDDVSYFGPLKKADRQIDLSKSTKEIYNLIRAVSMPYKGAFCDKYIIWTAEIPEPSKQEELKVNYPAAGVYYNETNDEVIIRLKDGVLVSDDFE